MKMTALSRVGLPLAAIVMIGSAQAQTPPAGIGYSPGKSFDQLSWTAFVAVVAPAPAPAPTGTLTFETWATDADTFDTTPPLWPDFAKTTVVAHNEHRFQVSALARAHLPAGLKGVAPDGAGVPVSCAAPGNPGSGNFPIPAKTKPPENCVAEEVRRNRASFDYIVKYKPDGLYSQAGLTAAFAAAKPITFPKPSVEIKVDWIPVDTVAAWLNANQGARQVVVGADFVRQNYFITKQSDGTEYAMISMHISTKDRPNWLWATFEHQLNPGRCDTMGCYDDYGVPANIAAIAPNPVANTTYAACAKSPALAAQFAKAGLPAVMNNYCLKDSQIDFVSTQPKTKGQPLLDGDSVIERITANVPIAQSSCISCHAYATFAKDGCVDFKTNPGLGSPGPIGNITPQSGQKTYDFVWGLIAINFPQSCQSQ
jgi:hypothetical protein